MTYHLFTKNWRAAKKAHVCIWCGHQIVRLDIYLREKSIYEGHHQNHAWHWDCWFDAQENYFKYGEEDFCTENERPAMLPFRCMEAS